MTYRFLSPAQKDLAEAMEYYDAASTCCSANMISLAATPKLLVTLLKVQMAVQ